MAKKIKLELTERQFEAMITVTDTVSAMSMEMQEVKLIDRMLKKNGYKRKYN